RPHPEMLPNIGTAGLLRMNLPSGAGNEQEAGAPEELDASGVHGAVQTRGGSDAAGWPHGKVDLRATGAGRDASAVSLEAGAVGAQRAGGHLAGSARARVGDRASTCAA